MSNNLYESPEAAIVSSNEIKVSIAGKCLAILGTILLLGLPIGIISTVFSMIETFQSITLTGSGDSKVMADSTSQALVSTVLGVALAIPGAALLTISILLFKYRKPWVYKAAFVSSIFALFVFPIGTILAILILVFLVKNKHNYFLIPEAQPSD
ncbi:MotA/TolQ/ExbB proton channel family protein [Aliikangiella marina]|uniref:MotA/TolQ/ExbB proton channel family protein n=1 Tax=Aliikangiella marina TaxID=1712262 RepID=A0A545TCT6_9GAMM|nr:MotA/TolQ/ExbB proton channel family protein [Aliikangiella marina]TQV75027.1 MotA/TolQ/ExbB proton channel family protein [Aliikangiella marina]